MRQSLVPSVALALLLVAPAFARADDAPAPKPPVPPAAPEPGAKPAEPPAPPAKGDDPAKPPAVEPPLADKPEPLRPAAAWKAIQKDLSDPAQRKPGVNLAEARSREYLAVWEASKQEAKPEDLLALGQLQAAAGRPEDAAATFRRGATSEALPKPQRAAHAAAFASGALQRANAGTLKGAPLLAAIQEVDGWKGLAEGASRARLLETLGFLHETAEQTDLALEDWAAAGDAAHDRAWSMAAHIVDALVGRARTLEQAGAARTKAAPYLATLLAHQQAALAEARKVRDEEQDNALKARRDQAFRAAESGLARMKEVDRPLRMLGAPAEEWTLVKAYGKGKRLADYRGKVVLLDFWATWCPWCIKSFPALRDLQKELGAKGLEVVGATTSAASVWDQRYALDDDLKEKAAGAPTQPTLKRPQPPAPGGDPAADNGAEAAAEYERALAEFRSKEQEVIGTFLANHGVTWDVVQIDEKEPAPKYALSGWPHCVVIDREGRVRHLHSGALLKDKPEKLAEFKKLLEDLLAEPAPAPK